MQRFVYTDHAKNGCLYEVFTEAMIEETIENPERTGIGYFGSGLILLLRRE